MKCTIPEISWHNRGPVLSVDIQAGTWKSTITGETFWRLASGGTDSHVLIWHVSINEANETIVKIVSDLERHQKTVNVVRFSPSGDYLASGDDESIIIIWNKKEGLEVPIIPSDDNVNKEQWTSLKVLRGHVEDVYDLSWSPDSNSLVSASLDNSVILWNVSKGKKTAILSDYVKGFPQGVTWDPNNKFIATISSDRICRIIDVNTKKTVQRISKSKIPAPAGNIIEGKVVRLFYDDTFKSFFRRLTYTPDGLMLIVPSGIIESQDSTEKNKNCTVVFARFNLKEPIAILPSLHEVTNAVRCCPVFFKLRKNGPPSMMDLPYRMVFAVATDNSIMIYDTQQISPFAVISNIHYTRLTDVTWSSDGKLLIASSSDGYCSIVHFEDGQLGEEYEMLPQVDIETKKLNPLEDSNESKSLPVPLIESDINAVDIDLTQSNFDQSNKKIIDSESSKMEVDSCRDVDETEDFRLVLEDTVVENEKLSTKSTPPKTEKPPLLLSRTPRRVQLITISSPKRTKDQ